jgi:hypothetical protein
LVFTSWVYPTEVFPTQTRGKGAALATIAFSLAGGTINEIIPYLINAVGFWVFILFALVNLAMLIPIYLFYVGKFIAAVATAAFPSALRSAS